MIKFNYEYAKDFISEKEIKDYIPKIKVLHNSLHGKTGLGNDFLGWLNLPDNISKESIQKIKNAAKQIQNNTDVFIVIGIGGSYLGAKAVIDALNHNFYNNSRRFRNNTPKIIFVGNSLSSDYLSDILEYVKEKEISINVISKSGSTLETSVAFTFFKDLMEQKYGKDASDRIFVTTENCPNKLYNLAKQESYETFEMPQDVGGRFSVLTPVGLLPIAVAGIDIDALLQGARSSMEDYSTPNLLENNCYQYAVIRDILYSKDKTTEILANYEPKLHFFGEWWKQLYGESEGKDKGGIFPATTTFTTDLHSLGQYIQDGKRNLFETTIFFKNPIKDLKLSGKNTEDLNYLNGKTLSYINEQAFKGTVLAHTQGGVPNLILTLEKLDAYNLGYLIYFFEKSCAISGYLREINPFNQPGVEVYKKNMLDLLKQN